MKIATITLNRPEVQNVLDEKSITEISSAFIQAQKDSDVRVIVLRAEGDVFCAGADPSYLQQTVKFDFNQNLQESTDLTRLYLQIYSLRKPVIAAVQGAARSLGFGLAAVCDFVLAAKETASFSLPEVSMGGIPAPVLLFLARRIGEGRTKELALQGSALSAETAFQYGIVSQIVPLISLDASVKKLADHLKTTNSASAMGLVKELFARLHGMSSNDALDYASNLNALARMTDDYKKGVDSLLKDEPLQW